MGGSVGNAFNPAGGNFLGTGNIPGVGGFISRGTGDIATGGLAEFTRKDPFYGLITNNDSGLGIGGVGGSNNPNISGPFSLDLGQLASDQNQITGLGGVQQGDINTLGQQQYDQTLKQIPTTVSDLIQQENPQIMEGLNKNHVLDSSAYPQEIAREQEYLTQNLAIPAIQQLQETQRSGLGIKQGFQTGALQRGMSMEDMVNQANISKNIGQVFAPPAPTGKQNFGTGASGIGALAPWFQKKGGALGK